MEILNVGVFCNDNLSMDSVDELMSSHVESMSAYDGDCGRCADCGKCDNCGRCSCVET